MIEKAVKMNPDGMDADAIIAQHCPSWYGMSNIEDCPRPVTYVKGKREIVHYEKAIEKCYECWNREAKA